MPSTPLGRRALARHQENEPGKIKILASKPLNNQDDLALLYSPGVAAPCRLIAENPDYAYDYTSKGNLVAVISNGTAVLGLGDLGALASKPVMEGKAVLFKRFGDINSIDIELDTKDPAKFIDHVKAMAVSFGGINLEDIKAPDCFEIEKTLIEALDIPVFHDDQHGTAIITAAGLMNGAEITGRSFADLKIVMSGAGAAAISCAQLLVDMGAKADNIIMCDRKGVIHTDRTDLNPYKQSVAVNAHKVTARTLAEALVGADAFVGLSSKGVVSQDMIRSMTNKPLVFAMANPDPEIDPADVKAVAPDAIIATGRSDYPNQVNNLLGFPYIFRGALDVRAKRITNGMKQAAAKALSALAKEPVPESVREAYGGQDLSYGPTYIIPTPFDPRLLPVVSLAVAKAAVAEGVNRIQIDDWDAYEQALSHRLG
jgi:malate dehydrogenase (oxaloacetate-decarboxylating)(NADP+)